MKDTILIIEDNRKVQDILAFALGREGYQVIRSSDGLDGMRLAEGLQPGLILVNTAQSVPKTFDVCRGLREEGVSVPLLALTAHSAQEDDYTGLDTAVIRKPFPMQDLLMKIKASTWEREFQGEGQEGLSFNRLIFDPEKLLVLKDGQLVSLVRQEYDLLYHMARSPGKVFSREELLEQVWGYSYIGNSRIVDAAIRRLRVKLEDDPAHSEFVKTWLRRGYSFSGG